MARSEGRSEEVAPLAAELRRRLPARLLESPESGAPDGPADLAREPLSRAR